MQKLWLWFPLVIVLLGLVGCEFEDMAFSTERSEVDFHYSYPLKPGGRLTVENFNGAVEISGWDRDTVDISGRKYAPTPELRDAIKIDIQSSPDACLIRTVRPSERRGNMGASYVIKVPKRTQLERIASSNGALRTSDIDGPARLKTSNGAVRTENLRGGLEAQTSNGSIELWNVEGGATLQTSNGRIRAEKVKGPFEAHTSNGGINAELEQGDDARTLRLETSNGSIDLRLNGAPLNDVRATTSNGGITLRLPASSNARVRAQTNRASIHTDFTVNGQVEWSKHRLEGQIGNGGPLIDLSTSNGGIRLMKM